MKFINIIAIVFLIPFWSCKNEASISENVLPPKLKLVLDSLEKNHSVDIDSKSVLVLMNNVEKTFEGNTNLSVIPFIKLYKAKCFKAEEDINTGLLNAKNALPYFKINRGRFTSEYIQLLRLLSIIYRRKTDKVLARAYINQAVYEINKNASFLKDRSNFHEIGGIYFTLANLLNDNEQRKEAIFYSRKSLEFLNKSTRDEDVLQAKVLLNMGLQYQDISIDSSLYYVNKGIQKINIYDSVSLYHGYELLGEFYSKAGKYDSSLKYLNKVIRDYKETYKDEEIATYDILMQDYGKLGNMKKANEYYYLTKNKYLAHNQSKLSLDYVTVVSDLLDFSIKTKKYDDIYLLLPYYKMEIKKAFNIEKGKALEDLEVHYKLKSKNDKIRQLESENALKLETIKNRTLWIISILSIFALLSLAYYLTLKRRKLETEKQKIELEQRLLLSQMNPHFMFNALSAIQKEIVMGNTKVANLYLTKYADLTRLILENSRQPFIGIEDELSILEYYLSLQKIRYTDKFDYLIEYAPELKKSFVSIPPMLIQPFIENSLEHGFKGINYKGFLKVSFLRKGSQLMCTIDDNGTGLQIKKNASKTSYSTTIVEERLSFLSKETGIKSALNFTQKQSPELGYHVSLIIPLHES